MRAFLCCGAPAAQAVSEHDKPEEYEPASTGSSDGHAHGSARHVGAAAHEEIEEPIFETLEEKVYQEWYNRMFRMLWPRVKEAALFMVKHEIEPQLKAESGMETMAFTHFDLGNSVPQFGPIRIVSTPVGPKMELRVAYDSDTNIECEAGIASFGINHIRFDGEMTCLMTPLIDQIPVVGAVCAYFLKPPIIEVSFSEKGGLARLAGNLCPTLMKRTIDTTFASMFVLPNQMVIPLGSEEQGVDLAKIKQPQPLGLVRCMVKRAENLISSDWSLLGKATSDPYVVVQVGGKQYKSSVVMKSLNPEWPQSDLANLMDFMVFDRDQQIALSVFDYDELTADDLIGVTRHLSVKQALQLGSQPIPLWSRNPEDTTSATEEIVQQGQIYVEFQEMDLVPGVLCGDKMVMTVKIDEITLPCEITTKGAKVKVEIVPTSTTNLTTANRWNAVSPVGKARRLKDSVQSRNKTLEEVIFRAAREDLSTRQIAAMTNLNMDMVTGVLGKKAKVSTTSTSVVEVEAAMYLIIPTQGKDWNIVVTLIGDKEKVLGTVTIKMDDLIAAENKQLPGPILIETAESGMPIEAEIAIQLSGVRPRNRLSRRGSHRMRPVQMAPKMRSTEVSEHELKPSTPAGNTKAAEESTAE